MNDLPNMSEHEEHVNGLPNMSKHEEHVNDLPNMSEHKEYVNDLSNMSKHEERVNDLPNMSKYVSFAEEGRKRGFSKSKSCVHKDLECFILKISFLDSFCQHNHAKFLYYHVDGCLLLQCHCIT